jgi:hypothetical protein
MNALSVEEFSFDVYRPDPSAPTFETEIECECGVVLPPAPSRHDLTKQLIVVACLPESQAKGLTAGRDNIALSFDVSFKALLKAFIIQLNKRFIDELVASIGHNPLNTPISALPRIASLWDFVNARPDDMGALDFKQELFYLNLSNFSIISGAKFSFAATRHGFDIYQDMNVSLLDGIVVDNHYCYGVVRPILGLNSFQIRVNGTPIGVKISTNNCKDSDIRITLGAKYGVFASKQLLETGVYHYKLQ